MSDASDLAELEELDRLEAQASAAAKSRPSAAPPGNKAAPTRLESETGPRAEREPFSTGSNMLDSALGAGELGLQGVAQLVDLVPKGIAGISGMLRHGRAGMGQTAKEVAEAGFEPYEPRTAGAREAGKVLTKAVEGLNAVATDRSVNGPLSVQGNSPLAVARGGQFAPHMDMKETPGEADAAGAIISVLPQAAAMLGPAKAVARPVAAGLDMAATAAAKTGDTVINTALAPAKLLRNAVGIARRTPEAVDRIKADYYRRLVGADNIPGLRESLENVDPIIPGSKPTVAEAVSDNPTGTALQGQQKVTAGAHGGPSADFNTRLGQQDIARESARMERDAVTKPMREAALGQATSIDKGALDQDISGIMSGPGQAVSTTRNFLSNVQKDIAGAKSAPELYAIRKRINDLLSSKLESDQAAVSGSTVELGAMKRAIDKSIEQGGGGQQWRDYLSEYADRSRAIDASELRAKEMYKPQQKTNVSGSGNPAEAAMPHLPNLLSRKVMLINALGRAVEGHIKPSVDASMAADFLDPARMAEVLAKSEKPDGGILLRALDRVRNGSPETAPVKPYSETLALRPPPGTAYEPGYQPSVLREGEGKLPNAESSRVLRETLRLQPDTNEAAFEGGHTPQIVRDNAPPSGVTRAESTQWPRPGLTLSRGDEAAFEPHNEAVSSSRAVGEPRTAPQWELNMPKPHFSHAEAMALIKRLREQE